ALPPGSGAPRERAAETVPGVQLIVACLPASARTRESTGDPAKGSPVVVQTFPDFVPALRSFVHDYRSPGSVLLIRVRVRLTFVPTVLRFPVCVTHVCATKVPGTPHADEETRMI